ncbi:T6SS immunity protein Tdi1 domain-containing protein [Xanthomonas oryzae]|uniref:T6SS immunity protein Tdi1 domain-containing protein n=1 Tax=Xanthomonas oryzae TaxID=347 RepID=UPI001F4D25AE|nr:T6SS immunity protein Tdi1 domain-containing protein [Xanthomonas oryzae]UNE62785.1 DUF1851 domain-containing protein [Xanthomonas oryzae]
MSAYKKIEKYFDRLPGRGGGFCFDGLLRYFCSDDSVWTSVWAVRSGLEFDWSEAIAYDVFGSVYGVDRFDQVYILSLDSGDISGLDVDVDGFFYAIEDDPVSTIRSDLYEEARSKLGGINNNENYALKVETALGGQLCVDNMYICDRLKHAYILGDIARQIKDLPLRTQLRLGN